MDRTLANFRRPYPLQHDLSLQALIDLVPDFLWVKDASTRFIICNKSCANSHNISNTEDVIGLSDADLFPPEMAREFRSREEEILRSGIPMIDLEQRLVDPSGREYWISSTKVPLLDDYHRIVGIVGVERNITARKRWDVIRNQQANLLEMIAKNADLTSVAGAVVSLVESQRAGSLGIFCIFGDDASAPDTLALPRVGPSLEDVACRVIISLAPLLTQQSPLGLRSDAVVDVAGLPISHEDRDTLAAHGCVSLLQLPVTAAGGAILGVFNLYLGASHPLNEDECRGIEMAIHLAGVAVERKKTHDRTAFLANHDALTGLPNRAALYELLHLSISRAKQSDHHVRVGFIDLDNFKAINDRFGHDVGDDLLRISAKRMLACLRSGDSVVRLGGDEFVVILPDQQKDDSDALRVFARLVEAVAMPMSIAGRELQIGASVGVASYPDNGEDPATIVASADAAMYVAKNKGRNRVERCASQLVDQL